MIAFFAWLFSFFKPKAQPLPPGAEPPRELPSHDEHRKIRLGVIVGHTKAEPGARMKQSGMHEYEFNSMIAELMRAEGERIGTVDVVIIKRDGIGIAGAYQKAIAEKCDAAIELHFNAFNGRVEGTETLCTSDLNDVEFAHLVQTAMCRVFDRAGGSRGVKCLSKSGRGGGNVHSFPGGVNCLVEPFFGDNPDEEAMAFERKTVYANALIQAVNLWAAKHDLV